jgi:hypothetical protein
VAGRTDQRAGEAQHPHQLKRECQCVSGGEVISRIRDLIKKAPPRKDSFDVNTAILEVIGLTHDEERGAGADNRTTHAPTFLRGMILEARARRLAISR